MDTEVPETLFGKKIVVLEMAELVAGAKFKGDFEERLRSVREEIINASGSIILFIDDFHTVLSTTGGSDNTAFEMLKPALAKGLLQCIGAASLEDFKRYVETDKALKKGNRTAHRKSHLPENHFPRHMPRHENPRDPRTG